MEPDKAEKRKMIFSVVFPSLFVLIMWVVEIVEQSFEVSFVQWGILPKKLSGLPGILLSPFIHSDYNHLINNSVPMLILGSSLFYFYRDIAWKVLLWIYLMGGFWTWVAARDSYHIGASGIIYGLFGFLLVSGFLRRHRRLTAISFLVAFLYGSMVWGIFPIDYKVSWEGHLFGLMAGIALAFLYRKKGPEKPTYSWEEEDEEDENETGHEYWNTGVPDTGNDKSDAKTREIEYIYIPKEKSNNHKT